MSDAGMTGDYDSVIGMTRKSRCARFTRRIPSSRFEPANGNATLSGIAVETGGGRPRSEDRARQNRRRAGVGGAGFLA